MDPYKVLGVTPQTSDNDIKRAYRELARKYHPDNYANSPLADLAAEKMKEINQAYDQIMQERSGNSAGGAAGQNGQRRTANPEYARIRSYINAGNIGMAEDLLSKMTTRDAEWHFLMGSVYYRKGWFDEAGSSFQMALSMDPNNPEYQNAVRMTSMNGGYGGYRPMDNQNLCSMCTTCLICNLCCDCMAGGC